MAAKKILIIGAGISGSIVAAELLKNLKTPANITMLDIEPGRIGGGIPYSASTTDAWHETNTEAHLMVEGATGDSATIVPLLGTPANAVMPRLALGKAMLSALFNAEQAGAKNGVTLSQHYGEAVRATDTGDKVVVETRDGATLDADMVLVATGNIQERTLPAARGPMEDPEFAARFVQNQSTQEGRDKIAAIPAEAPVLIIGTALSGYDAARSLLHNGHTGKITLISRHGLEHYQYPKSHDWLDMQLPRPRFIDKLDTPAEAVRELYAEFKELTGLDIDAEKGTIGPEGWRAHFATLPTEKYLPEQVLSSWEKSIPEITGIIGVEAYGAILKKYTSMINVLRIGAGHAVCSEMEIAKARGQLTVVKGEIDKLEKCENGIAATLTLTESGETQRLEFPAVISSLGPSHDYTRPVSPLWQDIIGKGYTAPHPVGVGVVIDTEKGSGALPGSDRIFTAGTPASGELIVRQGIFGPPAFSVPYMRPGNVSTAFNMIRKLERAIEPSPKSATAKKSGPQKGAAPGQ